LGGGGVVFYDQSATFHADKPNNCANLAKKTLPIPDLTINMCVLYLRINGCQSQIYTERGA